MYSRCIRRIALSSSILFLAACCLVCVSQQPLPTPMSLLAVAHGEEKRGNSIDALSAYNSALQLDPGNTDALFSAGRLRARLGDYAGAAAALRKAIQVDPAWAEAHYNLGLTLIAASPRTPDWTNALPEFATALKLRPGYLEAANMLAVAEIETGQAASGAQILQSALASNPNSAELHFNHGRALESTGQLDDAALEYATALKLRSAYPEAESALANIFLNRQDYRSAALHFEAALASNPDLERSHFGLAKARKALSQTRAAQLEFQQASALIQRQSDAVMSSHLSNESLDLAKKGDFAGAVQTARKALSLDPANAIAHYNLGLLLADSGDTRTGLLELRKATSLMPMRISAYVDMARMQLKLNDRAAAQTTLKRATLLDIKNPEVQNLIATVRVGIDSPAKNDTNPSESDAAFPFGAPQDSPAGHLAFAAELTKEGDEAGAIGELQRALELRPSEEDCRFHLALAYRKTGDSKRAELEFSKILYASPESVRAHLALADLFIESKDSADAVRELKQVLALQPDNREASRLLAHMEPIASSP